MTSTRSALEDAFAAKLPNAKEGEVVMRFAPEPSGYLHIGHAKAVLLNYFFVKYYKGRLVLRFDDTNPTKESMEFESSIIEDLKLLGVDTSEPSYTSDSIPRFAEKMRELISMGKAYADNTPQEVMRQERMDGIESKCRNLPVEESLRLFEEMQKGTEEGQKYCIRAKINMQDNNRALRDPVFYRCCVDVPHHRHGDKFKAYPTYDFACPLIDCWDGITHAMRANEYADRIPQYRWVQRAFNLPECEIYEFSRLNLTNTVLSKRKLKWLVDTGVVDGWDDPRFPTVRGILRRGLTVEALLEFLIEQGPSKNTNLMEWDKIWVKNSRIIDGLSKRFMAVATEDCVPVHLTDITPGKEVTITRPFHPKDTSMGESTLTLGSTVLIDHDDAKTFVEGESVTLMKMGNMVVDRVIRTDDGTRVTAIEAHTDLKGDFKKTKKIHWVTKDDKGNVKFILREYDHIITKRQPEDGDEMEDIVNKNSVFDTPCVTEQVFLSTVKEGDFIQFERRGFGRVDKMVADGSGPIIVILIPSGKSKNVSAVSTKVDAKTLAKGADAHPADANGAGLSKKQLKKMAFKAAQEAKAVDKKE